MLLKSMEDSSCELTCKTTPKPHNNQHDACITQISSGQAPSSNATAGVAAVAFEFKQVVTLRTRQLHALMHTRALTCAKAV